MLNLSTTSVSKQVRKMRLTALERVDLPAGQGNFRRFILIFILVSIVMLFMPWIQNFRAKGNVTALNPAYRPQTVHSTIPGRVEAWYVFEGDTVRRGDTIARLSETKADYFDPALADRTARTRVAKENSAETYLEKAQALAGQIGALQRERDVKLRTTQNKLDQSRLYVVSLEADLAQQQTQVAIADYQLARTDSLFSLDLKSLSDLEAKRLKAQEARAKLISIQTKLDQAITDVQQAELAIVNVGPEYDNKIAKARSDRLSALTSAYGSEGEVAKLESQEANYRIREGFRYIVAPQNGIVARVLTPGIGETVKEGEAVVSILPSEFRAAVEMYVDPFNLPLVQQGAEVRFLFDGWPAVFFSGWPGLSYGTFRGKIMAIDNIIDSKGRYRVLVAPDLEDGGRPWPTALRPGSGAEGVVLLNRVPVWYELWRQLNAFPPDYYEGEKIGKEKEDDVKTKPPAKSVIK